MNVNDGKLPVSIKIEPNIPEFVNEFNIEFINQNSIHNSIEKILKDNSNQWSKDIINFIKNKSIELYENDISDYFRISKMETGIKEVPIQNTSGTSVFNSKYETVYIGLHYEHSFLFEEEFKMIFNILRLMKNNGLKSKVQFTFNNIPLLIYTFDNNGKIVLTNKSKREKIPNNNDEFINYLNTLLE